MARLLEGSRSGLYAWSKRGPSNRAIRAERIEAKLAREDFRQRAPAEVVAREEARRSEQRALQEKLREGLERLDALAAR